MSCASPAATTRGITGEKWDRNYAVPEYIFGTEPNAFLVASAAIIPARARVLVPGDGEGRNGVWLAGEGHRVTTVDASAVGVAKARALAERRGVDIEAIESDLTHWPWPIGAFDAVVSMFVHMECEERRLNHRRMSAALVPGGVLILEAFSTGQLARRREGSKGGPPPEMLYTRAVLAEDFAGLEILTLEETETVLAEGPRHQGPAAVVRLIARRTV